MIPEPYPVEERIAQTETSSLATFWKAVITGCGLGFGFYLMKKITEKVEERGKYER